MIVHQFNSLDYFYYYFLRGREKKNEKEKECPHGWAWLRLVLGSCNSIIGLQEPNYLRYRYHLPQSSLAENWSQQVDLGIEPGHSDVGHGIVTAS